MLKHSVKELVLRNGSRGLVIDIPDASVMVCDINFKAGDWFYAYEHPDKWETAHIMEHLAYGSNKKWRSSSKFKAEFEKNGAYYNASTSATDMTYTVECADFEWQRILELTQVAITEPVFQQKEFEAECGNVYQELVGRGNNHATRLAQEMDKAYGLYVRTYQERAELISNVTIEDIRAHYASTHFSENMRFVVAGNLKGRTEYITEYFENFGLPTKGSERLEAVREVVRPITAPHYVQNKTVPNAYFYLDTYISRELTQKEMYALSTMNVMLTETLYSRIFGKARDRGLIYYLSSNYFRNPDYSGFWFGSQLDEGQMLPFFSIMTKELGAVLKGDISENDLRAAKQYQLGGFQRGAQTVGSILSGYAGLYFYNGEITSYYTDFDSLVLSVSSKDVMNVMRELCKEKIWGLGFLGSISKKSRVEAYRQLSVLWG
jgi:predicted Zn-dependent peptidase